MWIFKLLLLLTLIASWIPREGHTIVVDTKVMYDYESEEAEEEEENEEMAA
ncbi:MAG: hypothetical protein ACLGHN_02420 [Bacteriovoracia bacterium]